MSKAELQIAKPILFNTEMVKAILGGRKTQTRRVTPVNIDRISDDNDITYFCSKENRYKFLQGNQFIRKFAKYKVGDILYVRETWTIGTFVEDDSPYKEYWHIGQYSDSNEVFYKADLDNRYSDDDNECKWKPSIHMPKKYARIFLKVTNIRAEKLHDITLKDILKEGIKPTDTIEKVKEIGCQYNTLLDDWERLWNSTAKDGYKWEDNPYVFVYEFEMVSG